MKTLLVLAQHPGLIDAIRSGADPEQYRIVHRSTIEEAEPLLAHKLVHACIVDVELADLQSVWIFEKLHRRAPDCPVIVYTGSKSWEWEEEAYLRGVSHVLSKPVRPRLLMSLLERLWPKFQTSPAAVRSTIGPAVSGGHSLESASAGVAAPQSLSVLRNFSGILTHSLNAEAMLKQFLLLLRELLSINRAAIFLRQPAPS